MLTEPSSARIVSTSSSAAACALSASISSAMLPWGMGSPSGMVRILSAPPQAVAVQLGDAGHPHQLHSALDLVLEDRQRALDPRLAGGGKRVKVEPPARGGGRAGRQRF